MKFYLKIDPILQLLGIYFEMASEDILFKLNLDIASECLIPLIKCKYCYTALVVILN